MKTGMRHNDQIPMDSTRARDARLVEAALAGDSRAFGQLYDAWFDRVWNVALRIVRDKEVAAEVAQDTFVSAWRNLGTLDDADAFGGWLLRIARNASFNRQRKEQRSRPVDDQGLAVIEARGSSPASAPTGFGVEDRARAIADPAAVAEDGELVALVRTSAAALGERDAEVLDLQLRYGLTPAEIGEVMGMNRNAANQLCHRVRQRFATAVRARVLWRGDRPACEALAELLSSAGVTAFDAAAVKLADQHAEQCAQCGERRELRLQPAAMFAAVPLVAAPVLLKQQTAHALEASGVAMHGSTFGADREGGFDGGDGPDDGDAAPEPTRDGTAPASRRVRWLAMAGVALVVLVVAIVVLASRAHDGTLDTLGIATSSTLPATSVPPSIAIETPPTESTVESTALAPSTDTTVSPLEPPVPPTTPPPPPPTVSLTLSPSSRPLSYVAPFPLLTWSTANVASVRVESSRPGGPVSVLSDQLAGEARVCPGTSTVPTECLAAPPGRVDYVLRGFDGGGVEVVTRTVSLAIG